MHRILRAVTTGTIQNLYQILTEVRPKAVSSFLRESGNVPMSNEVLALLLNYMEPKAESTDAKGYIFKCSSLPQLQMAMRHPRFLPVSDLCAYVHLSKEVFEILLAAGHYPNPAHNLTWVPKMTVTHSLLNRIFEANNPEILQAYLESGRVLPVRPEDVRYLARTHQGHPYALSLWFCDPHTDITLVLEDRWLMTKWVRRSGQNSLIVDALQIRDPLKVEEYLLKATKGEVQRQLWRGKDVDLPRRF